MLLACQRCLVLLLAAAAACGSTEEPIGNTTLTVETIGEDTFLTRGTSLSVDFRLQCPVSEGPEVRGNLERIGPGSGSGLGPGETILWARELDLPPGPCSLGSSLRNEDGEALCSLFEEFTVASEGLTELSYLMICELF